eukprot:3964376-Amphidinium_carterae.1
MALLDLSWDQAISAAVDSAGFTSTWTHPQILAVIAHSRSLETESGMNRMLCPNLGQAQSEPRSVHVMCENRAQSCACMRDTITIFDWDDTLLPTTWIEDSD